MSARGKELFPEPAAASSAASGPEGVGSMSREELLRQQLLERRRTRVNDTDVSRPGSSTVRPPDVTTAESTAGIVSEARWQDGSEERYRRDDLRTPPARQNGHGSNSEAGSSLARRLSKDEHAQRQSSPPRSREAWDEDRGYRSRTSRSPRRSELEPRLSIVHQLPVRLGLPPRPDTMTAASSSQPADHRGDMNHTDVRQRYGHQDQHSTHADRRQWSDQPHHTDRYGREDARHESRRRGGYGDYGYGARRDLDHNEGNTRRMDRPRSPERNDGFRHGVPGRTDGTATSNGNLTTSNGYPGRDNGYGRPVLATPPPPQRMGFNRPPRYGGPGGGYGRGNRGAVDFEQRRLQREASTLSVWPPSPKSPYRSESESDSDHPRPSSRKDSNKRHRRSRYSSASDADSDSEDQDRRRRRSRREKERKRSKRYTSSEDSEIDERRGKGSRSRRSAGSEGSDREDDRARRRRAEKARRREKRKEDKGKKDKSKVKEKDKDKAKEKDKEQPLTLEELAAMQKARAEEEEVVGPLPPAELAKLKGRLEFKDMLPGEAEAMAHFLATGQRIPRRGEIGYDADAIKLLEESGYVMSGSRHKRMNAVRLRKENQVISAEEKRAILNLQRDETRRKEGMIISQFKELMDTAIKRSEAK